MPRLFIISGCNGAGKTTASKTIMPGMLEGCEFVNADIIAKELCPEAPEKVAITAGRKMIVRIQQLLELSQDFAIETTLAARTYINLIRQAHDKGYTVTLIYFWLNMPSLAVERVRLRVASGGHNITEANIRRRYDQGIKNLFHIFIPESDYWLIIDNSNVPPQIICEGGLDLITKIHNKTLFNQLVNYERTRIS